MDSFLHTHDKKIINSKGGVKLADKKRKTEIKKATALQYDRKKDNAPKIIAKGRGDIAQKIVDKAKEENIHIEDNSDLVDILLKLEIGDEIPPELYQVIAEILSFIYELENN